MAQSRKYIIPLRREFQKAPRYKRTKKAVVAVRDFLKKHMKVEDVRIGKHLNLALWSRGAKNPPHKVEVEAQLVEDKKLGRYVEAELVGAPKQEKLSAKKKKIAERLKDKLTRKESAEAKAEKEPSSENIEAQAKAEAKKSKETAMAKKEEEAEVEQEALEKEQSEDKKEAHAPKPEPKKSPKPEDNEKTRQGKIVSRTKKKTDAMKK